MSIPLKPVVIELGVRDVERLIALALDGSADEALAFIRRDLVKRVEKALQRR